MVKKTQSTRTAHIKKNLFHINNMLCLLKVNGNTIELARHTSCYFVETYSMLSCLNFVDLVFSSQSILPVSTLALIYQKHFKSFIFVFSVDLVCKEDR